MGDGEKRKDGENNIFNPKKGPHGMTNGQKETGGQSDRNKQNIKQKKQETEKQDVKQNDGQMEKDTGRQ